MLFCRRLLPILASKNNMWVYTSALRRPSLFTILFLIIGTSTSSMANRMEFSDNSYSTHKLTLNDTTTINYIDQGKGPQTLLFIHGLGSNLKAWQKNVAALQSNFRCIALDLPNYGQSSQGTYPFTMDFFVEMIEAFITQLELEQVVLTGHSMGAQIAMHFAVRYPTKLDKLILFAPAGFETFTPQQVAWFEQVYTADFVKTVREEQIINNFKLNFYDMPKDAQFMIDDRLEMRQDTARYDNYCEMIPQCVLSMLKEPIYEQLPNITTPTLIFYGEEDRLIPNPFLNAQLTTAAVGAAGAAQIPNAQLVMVPEAGHFVQWEGAKRVHPAILSFLK